MKKITVPMYQFGVKRRGGFGFTANKFNTLHETIEDARSEWHSGCGWWTSDVVLINTQPIYVERWVECEEVVDETKTIKIHIIASEDGAGQPDVWYFQNNADCHWLVQNREEFKNSDFSYLEVVDDGRFKVWTLADYLFKYGV